jgi:quercetin dioxygenase-like cupin family protein
MTDAVRTGTFGGLDADEPHPGITRRAFDSAGATVTSYEFRPGAAFPLHRHPQEQITLVDAGAITMRLGGESRELLPGAWSVVAGDVEHGITAGPDGARITAIIVPRRANADAYEVVAG